MYFRRKYDKNQWGAFEFPCKDISGNTIFFTPLLILKFLVMKTFNLESSGIKALTAQELKTINGGNPLFRLLRVVAAAAAAIHEVVCDGTPHNTKPSFHVMDRGAW